MIKENAAEPIETQVHSLLEVAVSDRDAAPRRGIVVTSASNFRQAIPLRAFLITSSETPDEAGNPGLGVKMQFLQ